MPKQSSSAGKVRKTATRTTRKPAKRPARKPTSSGAETTSVLGGANKGRIAASFLRRSR